MTDEKPKKARMVSTTIYVTEEQSKRLSELSNHSRVSRASYIREGVEWVLAKYKGILPEEKKPDVEG